jgi:hypothetical protein
MDSSRRALQIEGNEAIPPNPRVVIMFDTLRRRTASIALAFAPLIGVAAHAQVPKPVAGMPYQYWDVLEADGGARKVYFRNDSPSPMIITQVVIQRCENTRQLCGSYPANLVVAPGKTAVAFRIERLDAKLAWSYSYSFRTHSDAPPPPVTTGIPPGAVIRGPDGSTSVMQSVPIDSLAPDVAGWSDGATCGSVTVPDLPAGHKALLMIFGTAAQPAARQVMVRLDANGSAYDYSDIRRDPGDVSASPRRTQITIDLVRQVAMVRNSGGTTPTSFFRATGPTLLTARSLGVPGDVIAKIVKECGGG